jgi:glycosyltransferase involved in cell wall biosynthesis
MYHSDLLGGVAARIAGHRQIIWGIRNTDLFPGNGASRGLAVVMRLCARLSRWVPSAIVCVAESARKSHVAFGYSSEKMVVIQNGFVLPERVDQSQEALRREFNVPANAFVIGSAGRFNPYKDHRNFVEAMTRVADRIPEARFFMMGRDINLENLQLRKWIQSTGYGDRFVLVGERRDMSRCFALMDLFCLHSRSEGFPNVLAEAMLAGLPVVTTDVGDARLLSAGYGEVVQAANPEQLAAATIRAASLGRTRLKEIGSAARDHVQAVHSLPAVAERYFELYRSLLAHQPLKPSS